MDKPAEAATGEVYLTANVRHLLLAVASALRGATDSTILYLEDYVVPPQAVFDALALAFPQIPIIRLRDSALIHEFAGRRHHSPSVVRRNLRITRRRGISLPHKWRSPQVPDRAFHTGYLYHTGFFLSKMLRNYCDRLVLREDGLSNYVARPVGHLRALHRAAQMLPPYRAVLGDEPWIDAIEVARPEAIPGKASRKARPLTVAQLLDPLSPDQRAALSRAFLGDAPVPMLPDDTPTCLLLTQPLDRIDICSAEEKARLYAEIAQAIRAAGFRLWVKHHPHDTPFTVEGAEMLPQFLPIEGWAALSHRRFDLAVALCSASLVDSGDLFSRAHLQLLPPDQLSRAGRPSWPELIRHSLQELPGIVARHKVCRDGD